MSSNIEQLSQALDHRIPCTDGHTSEFNELAALFTEGKAYLETDLTRDLQPEQIVPGGDGLGTYMSLPGGSAFYGDPGETTATLERWVVSDTSLVRVSKKLEWYGWGKETGWLAQHIDNRWSIIPGKDSRRMHKIAGLIMTVYNLHIDEFELPNHIDDDVFADLRWQADNLLAERTHPQSRTYLDKDSIVPLDDRTVVGKAIQYAKSNMARVQAEEQLGPRPEEQPHTDLFDSDVWRWAWEITALEAKLAKTIEPSEEDVEQQRQYITHRHVWSLMETVVSLDRALTIVKDGTVIMPTKRQDDAPRWVAVASLSGHGKKTVNLSEGTEVTLAINNAADGSFATIDINNPKNDQF